MGFHSYKLNGLLPRLRNINSVPKGHTVDLSQLHLLKPEICHQSSRPALGTL